MFLRVDVFEELDDLVVEVELPGVQLGEVEVVMKKIREPDDAV